MLLVNVQFVLATILLVFGIVVGGSMLIVAGPLVRSSKSGKRIVREQLIDGLALRGDETVLDVGCGRGLLLTSAARRLTTGKAIGIDLWQSDDLSGNRPEATLANAQAERCANCVGI